MFDSIPPVVANAGTVSLTSRSEQFALLIALAIERLTRIVVVEFGRQEVIAQRLGCRAADGSYN